MSYDTDELTPDELDAIHAIWRANGWNSDPMNSGRDIVYSCTHKWWAAWGIPTPKVDQKCPECKWKNQ